MIEDKIDVAVNIFAKPFCTSLAILSLLRQSGVHAGKLWLQYEPMGIKYDKISPYCIAEYIKSENLAECEISQPREWRARAECSLEDLMDARKRESIRYQHAFENSTSRLFFLMHNDVFIFKDILGPMREAMGEAFAIGQLGQCWNCPAGHASVTNKVMGIGPCSPGSYDAFKPTPKQLAGLYDEAKKQNIFVRPYAISQGEFAESAWPLPECRINEWACLLDLEKTRPLCAPEGKAFPPGAYRSCGEFNLDIGVPWFRDMHAQGLEARHFDLAPYLKHWVGTGNNTPTKYAQVEDNALRLLRKHFPNYVEWLEAKYGSKVLPC